MSDSVTVNEMVVNGVTMVPKDSIKGNIIAIQSGSVGVWEIGKKYFVRTVTYHLIGELVHVTDTELLFKHASWVASSGRFSTALATGVLSEVEPFVNPVIMGRGAIVDASEWDHALPEAIK
jgi:hypothetical protein